MLADAQISAGLESMVRGIPVPPVPLGSIRQRIASVPVAVTRLKPFVWIGLAAAATIAMFFAVFPAASLALIERVVVDSYRAAYQVMGWTPPPPPPKALHPEISSERRSLAAAQSKVPFTIIAPTGLPADAVLTAIRTTPTLLYSKTAHVWSKGPAAVTFTFRRSGGRTFDLMAENDDPRTGPPPKYMYDAEDLPGGRVAMTKHARFAWKNGNQVMSAIEDDGITAQEIGLIRMAMHGGAVVHPGPETIVKQYYVSNP